MIRTRPSKKQLGVLALLASVAAVIAISCNWRLKTRTPALEEKKVAPDFTLPDHTGEDHSLDALLANGPAVIVFYRGYW